MKSKTKHALTDNVMAALYEIDGGGYNTDAAEKTLTRIANEPDARQEALF